MMPETVNNTNPVLILVTASKLQASRNATTRVFTEIEYRDLNIGGLAPM
jgi:hypothetical protein